MLFILYWFPLGFCEQLWRICEVRIFHDCPVEQVTRCYNIDADGWAGVYFPLPSPCHSHPHWLQHICSHTHLLTNQPIDAQTDGRTKPDLKRVASPWLTMYLKRAMKFLSTIWQGLWCETTLEIKNVSDRPTDRPTQRQISSCVHETKNRYKIQSQASWQMNRGFVRLFASCFCFLPFPLLFIDIIINKKKPTFLSHARELRYFVGPTIYPTIHHD